MLASKQCKQYFHRWYQYLNKPIQNPMHKADRVFLIFIVIGLAAIYSFFAIIS